MLGPEEPIMKKSCLMELINILWATFICLTNLCKKQYTVTMLGTGAIQSKTIPFLNCIILIVKLSNILELSGIAIPRLGLRRAGF